MWIDPKTLEVASLHADIRKLRPNWSGPVAMTDDMIAFLGFIPVVSVSPTYDPVSEKVASLPAALVDGVWTEQWDVTALPEDKVAANMQTLIDKANPGIDTDALLAAEAARVSAEEKETSK
jgi:hypothetical protein